MWQKQEDKKDADHQLKHFIVKIKTLFYLLNKRHHSIHQYEFQSAGADTKKAP
jgi:hypothetical protein